MMIAPRRKLAELGHSLREIARTLGVDSISV